MHQLQQCWDAATPCLRGGLSPRVEAVSVQLQFTLGGLVLALGVRSGPDPLVPPSLCRWELCKEREGRRVLYNGRGQAGSAGSRALCSTEAVSKDRGETPAKPGLCSVPLRGTNKARGDFIFKTC